MLFIWRGFGWIIPVILFGAFIASQLLLNNLYGEGYYENNEWPKIAAIIASIILIGGLGYFLNYSLVSKIRGLAVGQGACPIRDTARFQCI